jgi:Flp pilus assembly pilin Flp
VESRHQKGRTCLKVVPKGDRQRGATSVEYALLLSAITAVVTAIVVVLGAQLAGIFVAVNAVFP